VSYFGVFEPAMDQAVGPIETTGIDGNVDERI
jgi:hypothetical protein